jgi:hypothetical protein
MSEPVPLLLDAESLKLVNRFEETVASGEVTRGMNERAKAALEALREQREQ